MAQPDTWGDTFLQRGDTAALLTGSVGPHYVLWYQGVCPNTRCMCMWAVSGLMCVGLAADQQLCLLYLSSIKSQVKLSLCKLYLGHFKWAIN